MSAWKRLWVLTCALVAMTWLVMPQVASAKSFTFPSLVTQATVNADGSMDVVEHITYRFDGEFHNGTRPIQPGDYQIINMDVQENGQSIPHDGVPYNLTWHFTANNETRTFDISYRVLRAVTVGTDVGFLNWNWTGVDHPQIGSVRVVLTAPSGDQLRAWAHGPLSGRTSTNGNVVTQEVSPLPQGEFLESHLAMPVAAFTAKPTVGEQLPQILAQEQQNADTANAIRTEQQNKDSDERNTQAALNVFALIVAIGAVVAHVFIWRKWGREPARPADVGNYWYDAPDVAPATVVKTLNSGNAFAGTIVDLAQRGFYAIEEVTPGDGMFNKLFKSDDWVITKKKPEDDTMQPFERRVYDYLFQNGPVVRQSELKKYAENHPNDAREFFSGFESEVQASVDGTYWASGTGGAKALNVLVAVLTGAVGVLAVAQGAYVGVVGIAVAVVILVLTRNMSRRTDLGARKAAEWDGLKNYLKDFSNFKDAPVGHMILWERYLVYGVAFGVAADLVKGLQLHVPDVQNDPSFASWYVAGAGGNGIAHLAAMSAFAGGVENAISPPSDNSSSGSGFGGGGFSSGGGSGGGGGGFGAN